MKDQASGSGIIAAEPTVRRLLRVVDEQVWSMRGKLTRPVIRVAVAAVIANPYAGRFEADLSPLYEHGAYLGDLLTRKAVSLLSGQPVESFGKAAIVGLAGELEHAAALLHPSFGAPMRNAIGGGKALIPSTKKLGGAGTAIDVPLHHKDAAFVRSHFDAIEVRVPGAPREDEIVVIAALASGGRADARVGGLQVAEITGTDGLR